ncbi:MAG: NADH-quinone oxidoreductase subunit I [Syntrophobacteraceae bacterium]|nr:NADH-quinone oxidoreductase subunit I [Syntrophobacteraceae bacterium]
MGYFKDIIDGGLSLIEGMGVTARRLFQPLITVQYPRKKIPLSSAYRGHIELKIFEETGTHKCIVCLNCEKTCPSGVIRVQGEKQKEKGPKTLTGYVIDFSKCSLCGLCVEICPTSTLEYSREYELVGDTGADCVFDLMLRLAKQVEQREEKKKTQGIAA